LHIIADKRIPAEASIRLSEIGNILAFETDQITYPAISGHPDIFLCKKGNILLIASNTPLYFKDQLKKAKISFNQGAKPVGTKYPQTAHYNALITEKYLIHNLKYTDPSILETCKNHQRIHLKQAYTRCNLLAIKENRFITSDKGIEQILRKDGIAVLYVNPNGILLPGFKHGFFGGTCGIYENKVFFIGSLKHFPEGEKVRQFLSGYEIIELYNGPLFDGGSLIFI
jgi:rRNA-processing protein FCF1